MPIELCFSSPDKCSPAEKRDSLYAACKEGNIVLGFLKGKFCFQKSTYSTTVGNTWEDSEDL